MCRYSHLCMQERVKTQDMRYFNNPNSKIKVPLLARTNLKQLL